MELTEEPALIGCFEGKHSMILKRDWIGWKYRLDEWVVKDYF